MGVRAQLKKKVTMTNSWAVSVLLWVNEVVWTGLHSNVSKNKEDHEAMQ